MIAEFIHGPLDGEKREVPAATRTYVVSEPPGERWWEDPSDPELLLVHTHVYRRRGPGRYEYDYARDPSRPRDTGPITEA